jgi:hypothetical protein
LPGGARAASAGVGTRFDTGRHFLRAAACLKQGGDDGIRTRLLGLRHLRHAVSVGAAFIAVWVWLMALPGQIAVKRRHPDADAVRALG